MTEPRRIPGWLRGALALSGASYTVLLMQTASKWSFLLTAALSLGLMCYLAFGTKLLESVFRPRPWGVCLAAGILSASAVYTAKSTFYTNCWSWMHKAAALLSLPEEAVRVAPWVVALAAAPMAFGYFLWFTGFFLELGKELWRSSDFTERFFVLGAGILFSIMILMTYVCTQAFYGAHLGGRWYNFDLIYSADSGYLLRTDVYRNVGADQNDLRQPLFGLFAMPFAQAAWLLSRLLFFLPERYIFVWQILQMLMYLVAMVLLSRMMELQGPERALFLTMLAVSYPVLIFVLTAEQYLVAVFYLVLLLYLDQAHPGKSMSFVAATGCLLTSGIWFPLVTWRRDWRRFVRDTLGLLGVFVAAVVLSGRLTTFLDIPSYIAGYRPYTGVDVALKSKLMQYVNFAGACLLAPPSGPDFTTYNHISWQMLPVTRWSPVGLGVIALALGGILAGRKRRFTRICGVWLGFSLLLLGIVGWGTIDNGLMLYTLYFGWAFLAMIFQLVDRVFARLRPVKVAVLAGMILAMAAVNTFALRNVLVFAAQFYPALGGVS